MRWGGRLTHLTSATGADPLPIKVSMACFQALAASSHLRCVEFPTFIVHGLPPFTSPMVKSLSDLRGWLATHQRRLRAGDALPTITNIANRAGCHRDTIYALLNGDRVCQRTQYALSRVLQEVDQETCLTPKTRLMSLSFHQGGVSLQIGLGKQPLLSKR